MRQRAAKEEELLNALKRPSAADGPAKRGWASSRGTCSKGPPDFAKDSPLSGVL